MKKEKTKKIIYIAIAAIIVVLLLILGSISLAKVSSLKSNSIPKVMNAISKSDSKTSKLVYKVTDKIDTLDEKMSEEHSDIISLQKELNSATNQIIIEKYSILINTINKNNKNLNSKIDTYNTN